MKTLTTKRTVLSLLLGGFFLFETNVAEAVIGAPLTPVSVAGVARRTTRRAVVATSAANNAANNQAAAPAPSTTTVVVVPAQAPAPAPAPAASPAPTPTTFPASAPAATAAPPVGTIVTSLPPGSQSVGDDFICNNVYYRPTIQGSKLVYVVVGYK